MDPFSKSLGQNKFNDFSDFGQGIMQHENTKIKRKIYIPKNTNFNFTGLIIGPKGTNQKRLEEETGCKVLVRGKGSQKEGQPPQPDDDEDLHVLLVGDNEMQIASATAKIERIIFSDEDTRIKIRQEQLKIVAQIKNDSGPLPKEGDDLSMTTPYGPPSIDAYVIQVPNDCVGLVIGKGGETIRQLQMQSGAKKVQVAADAQKGAPTRNIFVEGDRESYERVKKMITDIVEQQQKLRQAMTGVLPDNSQGVREEVPVPDNLVGLIIGRGGETIKAINQKTGAAVFIPKECDTGRNERILVISGTASQVEQAKAEVQAKVEEGVRNLQMKALQASGIPIQWMTSMGFGDPNYLQQYLSAFDPQYAAMYQQMYAQQPVVTTVTDSSTLPGTASSYQMNNYQQSQMPNYQTALPNYQNVIDPNNLQMQGVMPTMQGFNNSDNTNMQYLNYGSQNPAFQDQQYQQSGQNNNG
jgi:transcription antitermination factor NusA-like protein